MSPPVWLVLAYKMPTEPAAPRVALWRKLKGMGAVYLQNGVCVVPRTEPHLAELHAISAAIAEAQGEAVALEATALDPSDADKVVARFRADRDEAYAELIDKCDDFEREVAKEVAARHFTYAELEENEVDLKKLKVWLGKITKLDFYGAERAAEARERLAGCVAVLEAYARQVFDAHDENR